MNITKLFYTDLITFPKSDLITLAKYYKIPITLDFVKVIAEKQTNLYKRGNMNPLPNNFHECSNDIEIFSQESWKDLYDKNDVKDPIMLNVYNSDNNIVRKECAERANILHDINNNQLFREIQNHTQIVPIIGEIKYYITRTTINALSDNSKLYALKPIGEFDYTFVGSNTIQGKTIIYNVYSLIWASTNGNIDIVKLLIDAGADINAKDNDDITALLWACSGGYLEIVKLLLEAGADPNIQDNEGYTALMWVSTYLEIAKLLILSGTNPNIQNKNGKTALIFASQNGRLEFVKLLIEAGADLDIKDKDDKTALMFASQKGHSEIVKLLIEAGADLDIKDKDDKTALMFASQNGHSEIVKLLIKAGADTDIKDKDGKTAIDYAKYKSNNNLCNML